MVVVLGHNVDEATHDPSEHVACNGPHHVVVGDAVISTGMEY